MKYILALTFTFWGFKPFAQSKQIEKPEYVIIANNEIISKERLEELMQEGYVKSMNKGVSQEYRDGLAGTFGNKIGDKEFIIIVELYKDAEKNAVKQATVKENNNVDEFKLHIGDLAKDFTVTMLDGTSTKLSELRGKVVLLNFWATWCAPCLMEFYEIPIKIIAPFESKDFVFIPISRGESKEKVANKMLQLNKKGIDFNVGIDPDLKIWDEYATESIPKSFVIDKQGVIRYVTIGNSEGSIDKLASEIDKLLKE